MDLFDILAIGHAFAGVVEVSGSYPVAVVAAKTSEVHVLLAGQQLHQADFIHHRPFSIDTGVADETAGAGALDLKVGIRLQVA